MKKIKFILLLSILVCLTNCKEDAMENLRVVDIIIKNPDILLEYINDTSYISKITVSMSDGYLVYILKYIKDNFLDGYEVVENSTSRFKFHIRKKTEFKGEGISNHIVLKSKKNDREITFSFEKIDSENKWRFASIRDDAPFQFDGMCE